VGAGQVDTILEGLELAAVSIDTGAAARKVKDLAGFS
jgi:anthranilate phosphoribosyltransferase